MPSQPLPILLAASSLSQLRTHRTRLPSLLVCACLETACSAIPRISMSTVLELPLKGLAMSPFYPTLVDCMHDNMLIDILSDRVALCCLFWLAPTSTTDSFVKYIDYYQLSKLLKNTSLRSFFRVKNPNEYRLNLRPYSLRFTAFTNTILPLSHLQCSCNNLALIKW